jgi:hypothetical protein
MTLLHALMKYIVYVTISALLIGAITYSSPYFSKNPYLLSLFSVPANDCPVAQNLTVTAFTSGDVEVNWDHPPSGPPNGQYSLLFHYLLPDGSVNYSGNIGGSPSIPSSSTSFTDQLTPGQAYRAILRAEHENCGTSPYAFYDFEVPLPQNCDPVRNPSASDITNSSVRLYWSHPVDMSGIQSYILRYSEVGGSASGSKTVPLSATNSPITGLQASTAYSTEVCTLCDDGTETCVSAGTITTQSNQQYSCSQFTVDIIGGTGTVCQGTQVTLVADPRFGSGPYDYDWSNGKTTSQITVTPNNGTAYYYVTVTDANGCSDYDYVSFYVNAPDTNDAEPEITASSNSTCGNSTVSLSVNDGGSQAMQGLQAYYPFQGDLEDYSGNNRDLSGDRGILTGGGLQLVSSGTAISSPNISSAQYYQTVSFYLKLIESPNGNRQKIFSFEPSGLESPSIWKRANDMGIDWQYDSQNKGSFGDFNLALNRWYHIVGRKSGTNFKLYVDGQLKKQVTLSNTYTTAGAPLVFGDAPVLIKEFKFYSRPLNTDEISGNWVWYTSNSANSTPIGTGQTIDVLPTATTTYYVRRESNCAYSTWASQTITISPPPSISITAGATEFCAGTSTTLTASTSGGSGCTDVKWEMKLHGSEDWEPVGSAGNSYSLPNDLDPGSYQFRAKYVCSGGCSTATSNTVSINISSSDRSPAIVSDLDQVCSGGTVRLRVEDTDLSDASLQVSYPFLDDLNDHSGNPVNLNLTGSGGTLTGEGLQLTTSASYVSPNTDILDTDEHTISFDIKYTSTFDGLAYRRIFYFNPPDSDRSPGVWRHRYNNGIHWRYSPGNYGVNSGTDLGVDQWHTVVGVKSGPLLSLYVDGAFIETANVPSPKSPGSGPLLFGGSDVVIRNFKAFNRSFSAKDIEGEWAWYTSNDPNGTPFEYGTEVEVSPTVTTTYYVRWLNDCGASAFSEITVEVVPDPSVTISEPNAAPPTDPIRICENGTLTLTAAVANGLDCGTTQWWTRPGTSGTWSTTGNTDDPLLEIPDDLAAGTYQYLVKYNCSGPGCDEATSNVITLYVTPYPAMSDIVVSDPACEGNNGSITFLFPDRPERTGIRFSMDGGNTYTSTNEDLGTFTFSGLAPGTYSLWTQWGNLECPLYLTDVTLTNQPGPFLNLGPNRTVCLGESHTFTPGVISGTPPFTYTWEDGSTGNGRTITPTATQDYALTVTDAKGCTASKTITVNVLEGPQGKISKQDATCDQDNGAISIRVSGGTQPYTYAWSNGGTVPTIRELAPGNYTVTVTDADGCDFVIAEEILELGILPAVDAGPDQTICFGESITLSATAVEGDPEFEYRWSMGAVGQNVTFSPESSAAYTVTLTDGNGCTTTDEVTVNVVPELAVDFSKTDAVNNQADGSILLEFPDVAGQTTIEFSIDGGSTYPYPENDVAGSFLIDNLAAGDYDTYARWAGTDCSVSLGKISILSDLVDDTYVSGCNDATILENQSFITETDLLTEAEIIDEAGRIFCTDKLTAQAGVKWYKWLVDDPGTFGFTITPLDPSHDIDFVLFELPAGMNNCEPKVPVRRMGAGMNDGNTTSSCSGATGLVEGQTDTEESCGCSGDADGFLAPVYLEQSKSYALVVINWTDPAGGFTIDFASIEQFASAAPVVICSEQEAPIIGINTTDCVNWTSSDGSLSGLYDLEENPQPGLQVARPKVTTTYTIMVTDDNGEIVFTESYRIVIHPMDLRVAASPGSFCNNETIDLTADHILETEYSSPEFAYLWSNGSTMQTITVTEEGLYTVTVTNIDAGCEETASIYLEDDLTASIEATDLTICSDNPVILTAYTNRGDGDLSYIWSTGEMTPSITVVEEGDYSVTITSSPDDCQAEATITLGSSDPVVTIPNNNTTICSGIPVTLNAIPREQQGDYSYLWSTGAATTSIQIEEAGTYSVTITDNISYCTSEASVTIEAQVLEVQITPEAPIICGGGSVELQATSGYASYLWNTGQTTASVIVNAGGNYSVTVTDANGCTGTSEMTVGDEATGLTKEYFVNNGYLCFPITLTPQPNIKEPGAVKSGECDAYVMDYMFNFRNNTPDMSGTDLLSRVEDFVAATFPSGETPRALVTTNDCHCDVSDFEFSNTESGLHLHLLDEAGTDDYLLIKGFSSNDASPIVIPEEVPYIQAVYEDLAVDTDNYGHINKTENLLTYTLTVSSHTFSDDTSIERDQPENPAQNIDPLARVFFECGTVLEEPRTFVSPAALPVLVDEGAVLRFISSPRFQSITDPQALTGFTILEGNKKGIWRGWGHYNTQQFLGYKNLYSGELYTFDPQVLSTLEGPEAWFGLYNNEPCPEKAYLISSGSFTNAGPVNNEAKGPYVIQIPDKQTTPGAPISLCYDSDVTFTELNHVSRVIIPGEDDPGLGLAPGQAGVIFEIKLTTRDYVYIYANHEGELSGDPLLHYQKYNPCTGLWENYNPTEHVPYLDDLYKAFYQFGIDLALLTKEAVLMVFEPLDIAYGVYLITQGNYFEGGLSLLPLVGNVKGIAKIVWKYGDEVAKAAIFIGRRTSGSNLVLTGQKMDLILKGRGLPIDTRAKLLKLVSEDVAKGDNAAGWLLEFFGENGDELTKAWKLLDEADDIAIDVKNNLNTIKALADDLPDVGPTLAAKPGGVKAWALMHEVGSPLKKDPKALSRLVDDLEVMKPQLENFIREKGATGLLAWKYMDEAYPDEIFCIN